MVIINRQGAFFMKHILRTRGAAILAAGVLILAACLLGGCTGKEEAAKVRDLEFTVIGQNEIPQELADMIGQKKNEEFKLTYTDGADLYIAVGYGEQPTGGYSITVPEFYLTENSIVIKTELQGPESTEQAGNSPSFPYIVIKTPFMEEPMVFQ